MLRTVWASLLALSLLSPVEAQTTPSSTEVYREALALSERLLPNPRWLQTDAFIAFRKRLAEAVTNDEPAAVAAHFNSAAAGLGFSHYRLLAPAAARSGPGAAEPLPRTHQARPGVTLLSVPSFGISAQAMQEALAPLQATPPTHLIIDLRGNQGGSFPSAAVLLGWLAREPIDAGVFVARPWFAAGRGEPDASTIAALPLLDELNLARFAEQLRTEGVARLRLPAQPQGGFRGRISVLIDGESASATEPVAWLLQKAIGATLIGERSAGAMLSSEVLPLSGGYRLRLPLADYYTAEGVRLEGRGVAPDVAVPADQALITALRLTGS